jgi:hypothetical protein
MQQALLSLEPLGIANQQSVVLSSTRNHHQLELTILSTLVVSIWTFGTQVFPHLPQKLKRATNGYSFS